MTIKETIYEHVRNIAEEQRKSLPPITDNLRMLESGLDSLCVAILIARLDDEFVVNPFDSDTVEVPVTFGDLVRIYEHAAATA
jgi:acyl carrier protein